MIILAEIEHDIAILRQVRNITPSTIFVTKRDYRYFKSAIMVRRLTGKPYPYKIKLWQ